MLEPLSSLSCRIAEPATAAPSPSQCHTSLLQMSMIEGPASRLMDVVAEEAERRIMTSNVVFPVGVCAHSSPPSFGADGRCRRHSERLKSCCRVPTAAATLKAAMLGVFPGCYLC
ncbi:unnamed protein product [Lactuca virosa]|uniref:Uncharacterized protein n=1 Tax=Lactuca virosa TaxID=75947 RepID=A0AAU9NWU3_9ASTR|nr:unnamed protein product [Lactuca virosa]